MSDQLPDARTEQAARDWFAQEASATDPRSLDPAALRVAAERRRRVRFTGLLAAAAVVVAALVIVPMALRPANPPITGIPAAEGDPTWATTAPPPLSARFGSLTAWLNGQFYLIGGWDGAPCPPGALCDMVPPDLRDGARYDPVTDTWTGIAQAPIGFGVLASNWGYFTMAATNDTLVVASGSERSAWSYQPAADRWQKLADLPAQGELVATGDTVFLDTHDGDPARYAYQANTDSWSPLPTSPLDSCEGWRTLADDDQLLVLARCGEGGVEPRTSSFDPATGQWSDPAIVPEITTESTSYYVGNDPVLVAGKLVWPGSLATDSSFRTPGIYDLEKQTWRQVTGTEPGGLAFPAVGEVERPRLMLDIGLVEANGNLLDVGTAGWLAVPQAPVPDRWDPVVATGRDSLLSCFGYLYTDSGYVHGSFSDSCHLLTLGPAAPPPTSSADDWDHLIPGWREQLIEFDQALIDPLVVAADQAFYVMGGHTQDASGDVIQSRLVAKAKFDLESWEFFTLAELPQVAISQPYSLAADVVGTIIYVHISFEETGELWAYDTVADSWSKVDDTDETQRFVGNADGLFRTRWVEPGDPFVLERLEGTSWRPVRTSGPPPGDAQGTVVVVDDHQLAWVSESVSLLNTQELLWQKPFGLAESSLAGVEPQVAGGAGSLVLVYKTNADSATPAGLEVFSHALGGEWQQHTAPTGAGGLNWFSPGPSAGRWIVVHGNLLDPATGEWQIVPEISDGDWEPVWVAGADSGLLTCFPKTASDGGGHAAGCWFYYPAS